MSNLIQYSQKSKRSETKERETTYNIELHLEASGVTVRSTFSRVRGDNSIGAARCRCTRIPEEGIATADAEKAVFAEWYTKVQVRRVGYSCPSQMQEKCSGLFESVLSSRAERREL